jgi:hypothetical protein
MVSTMRMTLELNDDAMNRALPDADLSVSFRTQMVRQARERFGIESFLKVTEGTCRHSALTSKISRSDAHRLDQ